MLLKAGFYLVSKDVPLISIIIPARNDAVALRHTLDHLQQLTGIANVEILVAASGDLRLTDKR